MAHEISTNKGLLATFAGYLSWLLFELFSIVLAAIFIVLLAPLALAVGVTLKLKFDPGPLLYRGIRLGREKREFVMYKFRTLPEGAQKEIGSELFSNRYNMLTPLTCFLRETRLDELPQLFNVLKRDMDFFGPRPVRPEIYRDRCRSILNYDLRFKVRPGLIGFSQLYTPHSAPKRIRAFLDNWHLTQRHSSFFEVRLFAAAAVALSKRLILRLRGLFRKIMQTRLLKQYHEKRLLERVRPENAFVEIATGAVSVPGILLDINEKHMKVVCKVPLEEPIEEIQLYITVRRSGRVKKKSAVCSGQPISEKLTGYRGKCVYVIAYEAKTPLNHYLINQYFLQQSIA